MRNDQTLTDLIASSGMGLNSAAKAAQVGRTSIWRWCRGYSSPRHPQVAALAAAIGASVDDVYRAITASQLAGARDGPQQGSSPAVA